MGRAEEAPNRPTRSGEGLRPYYLSHIHDLLLQLRVKTHNLHRLEAQRNDLNSKGWLIVPFMMCLFLFVNGFFCFVERIGLRCGKDVCLDGEEASDWQAVVEVARIIVPLLCYAMPCH